ECSFRSKWRRSRPRRRNARASARDDDVRRLRTLVTLLRLVLHLRTPRQRLVPVTLDRGEMNEQILPAISRSDESVPLIAVDPLHSSGCHKQTPPLATYRTGQRRRTARNRHSLK